MSLNLTKAIVFFDLETTGANVTQDRIVEIAALRIDPSGEEIEKHWLVNPGIPIPAVTTAIHGLSDKDVAHAPSFETIANEVLDFFKGADLGGYNHIKFDVPLLMEEFNRVNINFDIKNRRLIDAQRIFFLMEPRTLSGAYKFYCQKDLVDAHSAMADTKATYEVLKSQIQKYSKEISANTGKAALSDSMDSIHNLVADNMVDLAGRIVFNNQKEKVFNFGKHKGKVVTEIFKKEPGYYDWMMRGDFPTDTKKHLTEIKLSMAKMI